MKKIVLEIDHICRRQMSLDLIKHCMKYFGINKNKMNCRYVDLTFSGFLALGIILEIHLHVSGN